MRSLNHVGRGANIGDDGAGNPKLRTVLRTVAGEDIDSLGADRVCEFDVTRMVADDKGAREVDLVISLRKPRKIGFRLDALAIIGSFMRATINRSDADSRLRKASHDVVIDSASLLRVDVTLSDPTLVRDDEQGEIAKAAQGCYRLRVETDLGGVAQKPGVFDEGAVAVKEDCWFLHSESRMARR
ncbi:MAG: hypothetical protein SGJ19_19745 [Planctomycetia bacterium]|nr:hypothetical protein [Planctomycetia bacterium]